jgi:hypothetical protein
MCPVLIVVNGKLDTNQKLLEEVAAEVIGAGTRIELVLHGGPPGAAFELDEPPL